MKKVLLFTASLLISLFTVNKLSAQGVKIAPVAGAPLGSAILEIESTDKGILIPRLSLTARNVAAPVAAPDSSLLVFNKSTSGTIPFDVTPGFYYWDATLSEWIRVIDGTTIITDDQNIDSLTLTGTLLTTYIEDGTPGSIDLLLLASDASFYNTIRDSLLLDTNFTDSIQTIITSDNSFIDSIYISISDSLLLDTAWLSALQDSIDTDDQNIDSVTLAQTILSVFIENGDSASTNLIGLASDSSFYRTIRDSLLGDSTFLSSVDSLLLSDSTFIDGIIDSLLTSIYFKDSIFSYTRDSLLSDQLYRDSIYNLISNNLISDSSWLAALNDSIDDQNLDSMTLSGTTLTTYIEDGAPASQDLLPLASDSSFVSTIASDSNFINTLTNDSLFISNLTGDSSFVDSLLGNNYFTDSIYSILSDSLLFDSAWLAALNDSIDDQNLDSMTLTGTTLTTYIEDGTAASQNLLPLASDSSFVSTIASDSNFINTLTNDSLFISNLTSDSSFVDSLLGNNYFTDSIYTLNRDSLILDTNFLNAIADSIDSDVDSAVLVGDTILNIYEDGKVISVNLSNLKDSSEWIDGSLVGLTPGNIYARKALARGDTIVINTNGYLGINESTPVSRFHLTNDVDGTLDSVFVVRNSGNVGIGILNPTFRLETRGPNGDARINAMRVGIGPGDITSNAVVGFQAFGANTTGAFNTAIGRLALSSNTTGDRNTAVGSAALVNNTTGRYNVGLGVDALTLNTIGERNIAIGYRSLFSNTKGIGNTSIGYSSMLSADSGSYNTGFGMLTLENNTTGDYNTALGTRASEENITGQENTAIGSLASQDNITGSYNTSLGYAALRSNDSSDYNVGIGYEALLSLQKGNNNTALGALAGDNLTNGVKNIIIGSNIDFPNTNDSNQLNIGNIIYGTDIDGSANVLSTGNIGIGTQTPTHKLDISGQTRIRTINDTNDIAGVLTANAQGVVQNMPYDTLLAKINDSSEWIDGSLVGLTSGNIYARKALARGDTVVIDTTGKLGIGITPSYKLQTAGTNSDASINGVRVGRGEGDLASNTALGANVLDSNTTGLRNTAIGQNALISNTTGSNNTGVGSNVLMTNTTGDNNTAIGRSSLTNNTTGVQNTASGVESMRDNTTGFRNTASGYRALASNIDGRDNSAFGNRALSSNTSGIYNSAFGGLALSSNTTGSNNTAVGQNSQQNSTTSTNNVSVGFESMEFNTIGSNNTALGWRALRDNDTADFNTGVGAWAGANNDNGQNNTTIGYQALFQNVGGSYNVAIGSGSGQNLTSGDKNIILGSRISFPSATDSNQLNIGNIIYGTDVDGLNTTVSTGNIGIGVSNPTHRLDINGETRIRTINDTNDVTGVLTANAQGVVQNMPYDTLLAKINDSSEWVDGSLVGLTAGSIYARKALVRGDTLSIDTAGNFNIGNKISNHSLYINTNKAEDGILLRNPTNGGEIAWHDNSHFDAVTGRTSVFDTISTPNYGISMPLTNVPFPGAEMWLSGFNGVSLFSFRQERVRLTRLGLLGIGTSDPTKLLDVNGETRIRTINDTNDVAGILTANDSGVIMNIPYDTLLAKINDSSEWVDGSLVGLAPGSIYARKALARGDTIVIDTIGSMSIGTNNTNKKFIVFDEKVADVQIYSDSSANLVVLNRDDNGTRLFDRESFVIAGNNNPLVAFDTITSLYASYIAGDGYLFGTKRNANEDVDFHIGRVTTSDVYQNNFIIKNNGDIGVGTTTPTEKLEVVGNILASGTITSSDERYKKDIKTLDRALDKLMKLRGVSYFMKDEFKEKGFGDGLQIGVIAQEVEKVYPELVITNEVTGYKAVNYPKFTPILIEALKEQQDEIEALKRENEALKANNSKQDEDIDTLKAEMEQIKLMLNKQDLGTK